jgi:circadian clock protein KaiC
MGRVAETPGRIKKRICAAQRTHIKNRAGVMCQVRENMQSKQVPEPRARTGIAGLDEVLGGGLLAHRLYLVDGDPGSGKTTVSLQYLLEGVKAGEKCVYVTLSETSEELIAGAQSHGWSLDGIELMELIVDETDLDGEAQVTMYSPSEVELASTTRRILDAVAKVNPTRVVIDSLSELRLLAQSSLLYRRQILALKNFFVGRRCTVLLLDDRTSEDSDLQLHSIAHGVITLEQHAPLYGAARRRLRIIKSRGTDYSGGFHDFSILRGGIVVYPRLVAAEHGEDFVSEHVGSGVEMLDRLTSGGPARGTSTLLIGPAGSGKSTIAVQYAVAAAERGEHAIIFAFDETLRTLVSRTDALGINFRQSTKNGQIAMRQVDPAELSPGEFVHLVRNSVENDNAKIVIIDSLNGYLNAMPDERFLINQLHEPTCPRRSIPLTSRIRSSYCDSSSMPAGSGKPFRWLRIAADRTRKAFGNCAWARMASP